MKAWTHTGKTVHSIHACPAVLTRVGLTFIRFCVEKQKKKKNAALLTESTSLQKPAKENA